MSWHQDNAGSKTNHAHLRWPSRLGDEAPVLQVGKTCSTTEAAGFPEERSTVTEWDDVGRTKRVYNDVKNLRSPTILVPRPRRNMPKKSLDKPPVSG